ncbi:MAG: MvaI/BcnI family restriction endonuclease [bacterium]
MKLFTKDELINAIRKLSNQGWHKSVKKTIDIRNDGAVGNTLEVLLGIEENNLPIPNAMEWELKGQRADSSSLMTLKHIEPSPRASKIVPQILLPNYGWRHEQAGKKYPDTEMSFRSTTYATGYTNRGFSIVIDKQENKLKFVFNSAYADKNNPMILKWLNGVEKKVGLGPLNPEPYWGLDDLKYEIGAKIKNCFYIIAERKIENRHEYFRFKDLYVMSGFDFNGFLRCFQEGLVYVDFDARTGHNHGTKFRIRQSAWKNLYNLVKKKL